MEYLLTLVIFIAEGGSNRVELMNQGVMPLYSTMRECEDEGERVLASFESEHPDEESVKIGYICGSANRVQSKYRVTM